MESHGSDTSLPLLRSSDSDLARARRSQGQQVTNIDNRVSANGAHIARASNAARSVARRNNGNRVTRYNMSSHVDWKTQSQVEVRLSNVPHDFTTWEVYRLVEGYGNIIKVSLPDRPYRQNKVAYVKFQPPPDTAFWEVEGKLGNIYASLSDQNTPTTIPDPSNKGAQLPAHMAQRAQMIEFGFMVSEDTMMSMYSSGHQAIEFAIDLKKKSIDINFHVKAISMQSVLDLGYYRLQLKLDKMRLAYFEVCEDSEIMVIPLEAPPELYRKTSQISNTHQTDFGFWSDWDALIRQTDVVVNEQQLRAQPTSLRRESAIIDIGRWTTYRIHFPKTRDSSESLTSMRRILASYNVQVRQQDVVVSAASKATAWDLLDSKSDPALGYLADLQMMSHETFPLSFITRYQLEVCLSHGYLHENNLTADFLRRLHQLDRSGISEQQWRATGLLERVAVLKRRFFEPMDIFNLQITSADVIGTKKPPNHCTIIRSATITPTMVYFNSPAIEISNRVIRGLSQHTDRFLRVRFSEELDYGQIMSNDGQRNDKVYDRIRQVLRNGIVLGDRTYEFLAFGNSQFRDRGAYFFAPTADFSCQRIRDELGQMNPSDQVLPAKYCARLGQNFSTTRGVAIKVNIRTYHRDSKTLVLPDTKRNGFVFTDGVGKISKFLAKMIAAEFKLPTEDAPAVFQFRLGGCKGVLAVDPTLQSHDVHIRPSQYKFAAINHGLEIIRTSSFASASLNRQLILVLSALGVPDAVFARKMQKQLRALELALTDETVAMNELQKAVDGNQVTLTIAGMIQCGFMATREPFMMSLLRLWRSWTLKYLKEKAKLAIEKGAFLLGTVDETATLRGHYDANQPKPSDTLGERIARLPEVFCYVDRKRRGVYEAITGICILARNPSLHAGDIRVVRAVDVPDLHHLTNVVVFPQTGDRDVSNMCSGGDLDGDDYLLIWDEELIPQEWNHAPMDFTAAKPKALNRQVTVDDMTDFFVNYMKSDKLALIATTHLAMADFADWGVKDPRCKELAQLHSFAVDYPKSGVAVTIPRSLKKVKWPHFMEKRQTYKSHKVLGQLYDLVVKEDFNPVYDAPFDQRILGAFQHDDTMLHKIGAIKSQYDARIRKIMAQHDITTEFEVWSAFVMSHNGEKKDYSFAEELGTLMEAVRSTFRDICEIEAGGRGSETFLPFVAAMYTITARQLQEAQERMKSPPLISFPWIFQRDLGKIALGGAQLPDSVHRMQGAQKRHHLKPMQQGEGFGEIETTRGVVAHGEVFKPFDDQQQRASSPEKDEPVDEHSDMIERSIRGRRPEQDETRRDAAIKSLKHYHELTNGPKLNENEHENEDENENGFMSDPSFNKVQDGNMKCVVDVELDLDDDSDED